jgi:hypothetical protein
LGSILASVSEAVYSGSDLEGRVIWVVSAFSQVDYHRALLNSVLAVFFPDILRLLVDPHAKRATSQKVRESFHLRAVGCPNDKGAFHLVAREEGFVNIGGKKEDSFKRLRGLFF